MQAKFQYIQAVGSIGFAQTAAASSRAVPLNQVPVECCNLAELLISSFTGDDASQLDQSTNIGGRELSKTQVPSTFPSLTPSQTKSETPLDRKSFLSRNPRSSSLSSSELI